MDFLLLQICGSMIVSVGVVYVGNSIKKGIYTHLKLQKDACTPIEIDKLPKIERYETVSSAYSIIVSKQGILGHLSDFDKLLSSIDHVDKTTFLNHIPHLKVYIDHTRKRPKGDYKIDENMIVVNPEDERATVYYNLLKASISRKVESTYAQGFTRYIKDDDGQIRSKIGYGLTIPYLDMIYERYFSPIITEEGDLDTCSSILSIFEELIGYKTMERLFFSSALDELVDILSPHITRKQTIKLIRNIDHLYEAINTKNVVVAALAQSTFRETAEILAKLMLGMGKSKEEIDALLNLKFRTSTYSYSLRPKDKTAIKKLL
ncbi:MAG TPA: hypothetical protein DCY94_04595 [Firmicutes bacterium]|nr:hypothetical protein [Bacillota bacterium]